MPASFQGRSSQTKLAVWGICRKNRGGIQLQPSSLSMPSSVQTLSFRLGIFNPEMHPSPFPLPEILANNNLKLTSYLVRHQ